MRDSQGRWSGDAGAAVGHIAEQTAMKHSAVQAAKLRSVMTEEQAAKDRAQDEKIAELTRQIRSANATIAKVQQQREGTKHRLKVGAMAASLVGGAVLAGAEAKLGIPGLAQIATSITPGMADALFEWRKRL